MTDKTRWRTVCKGPDCRAEIAMIPTGTPGKSIPLNVNPSIAGNVTVDLDLLGNPVATVLAGIQLEKARSQRKLFVPHWATCPNADMFSHTDRSAR